MAVLVWYLSLGVLGLAVFPLLRLAFPGLADRGCPLARTAGLLLLSYLVWLAGSFRIPFSRPTIWIVVGALVIMGLLLAYRQRGELSREFRYRWRYYLLVEGFSWLFSSSICSSVMETLTCGTPTMAARSPWTSPSSTPS